MPATRFFLELRRKLGAADLTGDAAALAYYLLFSIFPFFLFLTALLAYLPIPHVADQAVILLKTALPPQAATMIAKAINGVIVRPHGDLLSVGALLSLWASSSAVSAFSTRLNRAYEVKEQRPYWRVRLIALALTLALTVLVVGAVALSAFGSIIGQLVATKLHSSLLQVLWSLLRWPLALGFVMIGLMLLYSFGPSMPHRGRDPIPGAVLAVIGIALVSAAFSFYVSRFGSYNRMYGSIGGIIILLTWFFLMAFMALMGGIVNAILEQRARTTRAPLERRKRQDRRQRHAHIVHTH